MEHHNSHKLSGERFNSLKKAFIVGIILNFGFVLLEFIAGLIINSLSLIADAGHNLADVGTLALGLLGLKLSNSSRTKRFTYGFGKVSVIIALINSIILIVSVGVIGYEAIQRLDQPKEMSGIMVAVVATAGILVNSGTAFLLFREKNNDVNVKSSFLHMVADALVSVAVVVGGLLMYYFNWYQADSILSLLVAVVILIGSWQVLKESIFLTIDSVPMNIDPEKIRQLALNVKGVTDLHHIHIWALSTNQTAMTAHLVLKEEISNQEEQKIKDRLKHSLEDQNIHHVTLETERENNPCQFADC